MISNRKRRSGAIGRVLNIVNLIKDMAIVLRFNVYLSEIRRVMYGLDDKMKCAAVRLIDEKSGLTKKLYVAQKLEAGIILLREVRG